MDIMPHEIINLVRLGMEERVISSKSIWMCVSCGGCSARCPNGIDVLSVVDGLRRASIERGAAARESYLFHSIFLDEIRKRGRVHELSLVLRFKKAVGRLFKLDPKELKTAFDMLLKGKLKLFPQKVKAMGALKRAFEVKDA